MTEKDHPPLSVCVPTKNAADTIERCLESAHGIADEIVVLDSNSTDGTRDICRQYGAEIRDHNFTGFAALRRALLDAASNDWVLLLDADEALSDELVTELETELSKDDDCVAYYIPKTVRMFGSWVQIGRAPLPWMGRKDALEITDNYVHEKPQVRSEYEDRTRICANVIQHYSFENVSDHLEKTDQYTSLEALDVVESDSSPTFARYLVRAFGVFWSRLLLRKGILDGFAGVFFAFASMQYELVTYAKIRELQDLRVKDPEGWKAQWVENRCQR
ncbi:glycosyltransferase family 2 protein [Haloarcula sp. AONF1]